MHRSVSHLTVNAECLRPLHPPRNRSQTVLSGMGLQAEKSNRFRTPQRLGVALQSSHDLNKDLMPVNTLPAQVPPSLPKH